MQILMPYIYAGKPRLITFEEEQPRVTLSRLEVEELARQQERDKYFANWNNLNPEERGKLLHQRSNKGNGLDENGNRPKKSCGTSTLEEKREQLAKEYGVDKSLVIYEPLENTWHIKG